jgi:hypothetical protein
LLILADLLLVDGAMQQHGAVVHNFLKLLLDID